MSFFDSFRFRGRFKKIIVVVVFAKKASFLDLDWGRKRLKKRSVMFYDPIHPFLPRSYTWIAGIVGGTSLRVSMHS